jgi:hypothetical protein
MATQVNLKSREQYLGDLIRKTLAETDLNDVSPGSSLSVTYEGFAAALYQASLGALKILENTDLDSLVGNALDKRAESIRLPNTQGGIGRIPAQQSNGPVTIGSAFKKISSKFYAGKPAPFAGSTIVYLEDASGFTAGFSTIDNVTFTGLGRLYVGRGTADRFEGPIPFTVAVNNGSFWTITLSSPLTKNHLYADLVVLSQGGDRTVAAGTIVQTIGSSESPVVQFKVTSPVVLPDGESEISASVSCTQFGEAGNALLGGIKQFANTPFPGATVTNPTAFANGRSTESDEDLRKRIKNYPATLSRGTTSAIQAALQGLTDPVTGRTITSSSVIEPIEPGDFSRVYIDDGSGLEPTFAGQPYELLLQSASGQETQFRTAQYPITPSTAIGSEVGPFVLAANQVLNVVVDGVSETYTVTAANYQNLNAATAYEIVRDFNSQSNIVGFRTINGGASVVITDLSGVAETLQVLAGDLQKILGFPTVVIRPIFVYQNSVLKSFRGRTATLQTNPYPWGLTATLLTQVPVIVDGVTQTIDIADTDFAEFASDIASATLPQWATVFSRKIAGVKFEVAGNTLIWTTRQTLSSSGTLQIPEQRADGSPAGWVGDSKLWLPLASGGVLSDAGAPKDYGFNRFTGELRFTTKPAVGTTIEIGTRNTRAYIASIGTSTGLYSLAPSSVFGNARMLVGFDGEFAIRTVGVTSGSNFTPTIPDPAGASNVVRLFANTNLMFVNAHVGDFLWLIKDLSPTGVPWWGSNIEAVYRLKAVGQNISPINVLYAGLPASVTNGSSLVTVTHTAHGFKSGGRITVVTSTAIGGIPAGPAGTNLSQTLTTITVLNKNQYTYDTGVVGTGGVGSLDQVTYIADTWIEFEVSSVQLTDWLAGPVLGVAQPVSVGMINMFKCDQTLPQLVDFGPVGNVSVDAVVTIINQQIAFGMAAKTNGQQFTIRSNDWARGTAAVLAVVATASNIVAPTVASSQQSHTAYTTSGYSQAGAPVVKQVVVQTVDYPTRTSLTIDRNLTDILVSGNDPAIDADTLITDYPVGFQELWITGRQYGLTARVYNNQTSTPFTGFLSTSGSMHPLQTSDTAQTSPQTLNRYANYSLRFQDLAIAANDRFVVEMDLDPINKTVAVPLFKRATIQDIDALTGSGKGQVISFRLQDPDDSNLPFFAPQSIYSGFDFRDFKMLVHDVGLYRKVVGFDLAAYGSLTALPVSSLSGISNNDTFTLNDGVNVQTVFTFYDGVGPAPAHPVTYSPGAFATGSLTAIAMAPGTLLDEGDTFTLNDGIHAPTTFEFDSDLIIGVGHVPVTYIHGVKATGTLTAFLADYTSGITDQDSVTISDPTVYVFEFDYPAFGTLTAVAANPGTGIVDTDTFTISDGVTTYTFEFDTNSSVTPGNIAVPIGATDSATVIKNAIIFAVNGAAFGVTASAGAGNLIHLLNSGWGAIGNVLITQGTGGAPTGGMAFTTLSPTGMAGGGVTVGHTPVFIKPGYSSAQVKVALVTAINGSAIQVTATPGVGDLINLQNDNYGVAGNVATSQSFVNGGVSLLPTGMSGGIDNANANTIATAMRLAINTASLLNITAAGAGATVSLANTVHGTFGNQTIAQSIASGASLTPGAGMTGGLNDPTASTIKGLMISAINTIVGGLQITAYSAEGNNILLVNDNLGPAGNQPILQSIASGASLLPTGMSNGSLSSMPTDIALVGRSVSFGGTSQMRLALLLPTLPDSLIAVTHLNDFQNGIARTNILVALASGSLIAGSTFSSGSFTAVAEPTGSLYLITFTAPGLNSLLQYQPGHILNVAGNSQISGSFYIIESISGLVRVLSPSHCGVLTATTFNASINTLSSFPLADQTWHDVAAALNAYLPSNPVITATAIGATATTDLITEPTYVSYPSATPYTGDVLSVGLLQNSFAFKHSGAAGIWQYDIFSINGIKATVQSDDSIFPTITEAGLTPYTPIGEEVMVVPTNTKTMVGWLNFNAASSLIILAQSAQVQTGAMVQISSLSDGANGALRVTGVTANTVSSFVIGNGTDNGLASQITILSADAKALLPGQLVSMQNSIAGELLRPYRSVPTGTAITTYNSVDVNSFFRPTNSVKYQRLNTSTGRLIFFRFGQGPLQTEPLSGGDQVTLTNLGAGRVRVSVTPSVLAARTGDMMYIRPTSVPQSYTSPFTSDIQCLGLPVAGITNSLAPEYWGYPVTKVIDAQTIEILAPNIVSFGTTALVGSTDLVFLPVIYNEKNIRTNKHEGAKFSVAANPMYYLVKTLGSNLVSLWVQNSAAESTDTMRLSDLSVNTDDYLEVGEGFSSVNQGIFKIIAHNGRNHVVFYNPNGGTDEVIDTTTLVNGGTGQRDWRVGPLSDPAIRPLRVIDAESVKIGDRLRISTPVTLNQWFPSAMFGTWRITGMGFIGIEQAIGTLTAVAAGPAAIVDGDTFTISDGVQVYTFEFDSNSSYTVGHIPVVITAVESAGAVQNAIIAAINSLGANFGITASLGLGTVVKLLNRRMDPSANVPITTVHANVGGNLTPTGMSGAAVSDGQLAPFVEFDFPNAINEIFDQTTGLPVERFEIAGNASALGFVEATPFLGYRLVAGHSIDPQTPEDSNVYLVPQINTSKMSATFGTELVAMGKLGFEERTFQGIDGYKIYSGLIQQAHRTIDSLPTNTILYPGVKAMGAQVDIESPLIKTVQISLIVHPKDGVTINSIAEIIKSTVSSYVNRLGVGQPVVLSEIIRTVQSLAGVFSVQIVSTTPAVTDDRIVVSDIEKAFILNAATDITVG